MQVFSSSNRCLGQRRKKPKKKKRITLTKQEKSKNQKRSPLIIIKQRNPPGTAKTLKNFKKNIMYLRKTTMTFLSSRETINFSKTYQHRKMYKQKIKRSRRRTAITRRWQGSCKKGTISCSLIETKCRCCMRSSWRWIKDGNNGWRILRMTTKILKSNIAIFYKNPMT